jgi:branched-subunit amino acid aminotransferase/4-amino-4-deoxychorismate lyase
MDGRPESLSANPVLKNHFLWWQGWKNETELPLALNRSFQFGDGFFESMRFLNGKSLPFQPFHWSRIRRSVEALRFPWPDNWDEETFFSEMATQFPNTRGEDLRLKLIFFRTGTARYATDSAQLAVYGSLETGLPPWIQSIEKPGISETVVVSLHPFSWIKSTSAQLYVMANMERQERQLDDLILCSPEGWAVEGCYSSISWGSGGHRFFPDPSLGGFDSCHRRFLEKDWSERNLGFSSVRTRADALLTEADWILFGSGASCRIWSKTPAHFPWLELESHPGYRTALVGSQYGI